MLGSTWREVAFMLVDRSKFVALVAALASGTAYSSSSGGATNPNDGGGGCHGDNGMPGDCALVTGGGSTCS
jgi:hypothetical protein